MTNPLKKALRGAAGVGAELSMDQYRANLDEKKQARLQQYQTGERLAEQEFRTSERVAGEQHDKDMANLNQKLGGGGTQGDIQLMNYFQEKGIARTPEEAYNKVRELDTDPTKVIVDIAKGMYAADDSKSFDEHLKRAEADVKALRERMNPGKPKAAEPIPQPTGGPLKPRKGGLIESLLDQSMGLQGESGAPSFNPTSSETVRIQNDDDYKKLASGTRYIAPDGKLRVKK